MLFVIHHSNTQYTPPHMLFVDGYPAPLPDRNRVVVAVGAVALVVAAVGAVAQPSWTGVDPVLGGFHPVHIGWK